jgi:signal transduction histidine kinase/CheY-like chemotaxis protein
VSTSVASGDLTRQVQVQARGEVAELKDTINQMIVALRETTTANFEQGWLDSNLARIGGLLQGQRDLGEVCQMIMNEVSPLVNAQVGAFFLASDSADATEWKLSGGYALPHSAPSTFTSGEGMVGQAGAARQVIHVREVPAGYLQIRSGIGSTRPASLVVLPVLFEGESLGVIEFASVTAFSELHLTFLERLVVTIGVALKTIQVNRRTEELLAQSQQLAAKLQAQSAELQRTNAEIEAARRGVEEKAQQLALASQYKSEFLANMSHELRTPLNSLLVLSRLLADNPEHNLSPKQIEFANTIHSAGSDLLTLIDDILDLSKIEAGRVDVEPDTVNLYEVGNYVEQAFRPQAEDRGLRLHVELASDIPLTITTDGHRLQQILRNLLSNAVKFTDEGSVRLRIEQTQRSATYGVPTLDAAAHVIAFAVEDTGIGIPDEKLAMIFEAFQQADGTTSRKYGGTGLGLSISKELARMLGGAIAVSSELGAGSTFTLLLPDKLPADRMAVPRLTARLPENGHPDGRPAMEATHTPILQTATLDQPAPDTLHGVTVLIVDDDVRNVFALTSALELHGLTVLYADNGSDGIQLLTQHPETDIVLMDAMMPNLDGNETTRLIRALPQGKDLPVVFLTAKAMPGDRETSLAAGASDYITKPVDLDQLLSVIASWVAPEQRVRG